MGPASGPKRIYVPVALLVTFIALTGFWRTYFGPLLKTGSVDVAPVIHIHAVVVVGWLALVAAQGVLAATGRTALHVKVGKVGMWYGLLVIVLGLLAAFNGFASRIHSGKVLAAQRFLWGPLTDLVTFAVFFGAAWAYRRKPEIHKRLIVVATTTLLIAAVGRLPF
jgi:phosphoglycerol transferase MdoB-like AlkP superfamily enzyme